ncbi:MAG TPA: MmgE/PrpD family protein [Rhizomicrobium sp.]|jgi:2-methylcitrate dehydratase
MTEVEELARFAARARCRDLSQEARTQLKIRVLDSLGCAIGALDAEPVRLVRQQVEAFGGNVLCTLIGGGKSAPDRAAFLNGALVRYLDFMDAYLAKGETCHPSDNLAPVLAAAEFADAGGRDFLAALAVAYQVQARLSDEAPVRDRGFDHTVQGAYAAGAGVARALGLDDEHTAHAIALAAVGNIALRVTRTGALSHWKGLAYANTAFIATHGAFLASRGVAGPLEIFEGNKGLKESVSGPFAIDWRGEDLERVRRTIVKRYDAEIHAQSAIEGVLDLRDANKLAAAEVESVTIDIFDVAYRIIGGGEEGPKVSVRTKEDADHSLPYMVAAALCDGALGPAQYAPGRIAGKDVQELLRHVEIRPDAAMSAKFPEELACRIAISLRDGRRFETEKHDYHGFQTRPLSWEDVTQKFCQLCEPFAAQPLCTAIVDSVERLEGLRIRELTRLLGAIPAEAREQEDFFTA